MNNLPYWLGSPSRVCLSISSKGRTQKELLLNKRVRDGQNQAWSHREGGRGSERQAETDGDRAGLKREVRQLYFLAKPQMPPLGTAWIYLPPRKIPLDFLGAQTGWAAKAGGGSSLGRWPESHVAAKSHPKLLTAQTCSWGGARSLRGPGVGARLPQFHSPEGRRLAWGPPEEDSRGKAFPAKSLCKGLEVSRREGWRKCLVMKFVFFFCTCP